MNPSNGSSRSPENGPNDHGPDDASFWWLDESASSSSRPSDVRMNLERLRRDVQDAPDLSARILGQAGRHDVFVPRGRRNAIRAMRWGAAAAAALALGVSLFVVYQTPAGEAVLPDEATPVSDLVADLSNDAERVAENVRALPTRMVFANKEAGQIDAALLTPATPVTDDGYTLATLSAGFSAEEPVRDRTVAAISMPTAAFTTATPLGVGSVLDALDQLALVLRGMPPRALAAPGPGTINASVRDLPAPGLDAAQAGFFAGEPDPR